MAEKYKGQVEFLLVYIREAHPTDGWDSPANHRDNILITKATNYGEKEGYASACVRNLGIKFTTVVDKMDAKVELNYLGWPDRMYLVGKDGRIAWKGDPGPRGFQPPKLEAAIRAELGK
jgi:iodothyronine deiodinase-like protein